DDDALLPSQRLGSEARLQGGAILGKVPILQQLAVVCETVVDHGGLLGFCHRGPVLLQMVAEECKFHRKILHRIVKHYSIPYSRNNSITACRPAPKAVHTATHQA